MGWVVYDEQTGNLQKYYKKAATARRIVTQHNNPRYHVPYRLWACCSYSDYEGILMGLRGDAYKVWQFCHSQKG